MVWLAGNKRQINQTSVVKVTFIPSLQGDGGTDRVSDFVDGGRMALDNKTSLLNTPLLSSSPRGAREHLSDSPFKHSRKDTSMDDSELLTDGTPTLSDRKTQTHCTRDATNTDFDGAISLRKNHS